MIKVRVGAASFDGRLTAPEAKKALEKLQGTSLFSAEIITVNGTWISRARNLTVTLGKSSLRKQTFDWDYYLATDDDVGFIPKSVQRLIELDLDIVGCAYAQKANGSATETIAAGYFDKSEGVSDKRLNYYDSGLIEVDWIGMGCTLIKKRVFEALEYPYFRHLIVEHEDKAEEVTEDIGFCVLARRAGFKVFCDLNNRAFHASRV